MEKWIEEIKEYEKKYPGSSETMRLIGCIEHLEARCAEMADLIASAAPLAWAHNNALDDDAYNWEKKARKILCSDGSELLNRMAKMEKVICTIKDLQKVTSYGTYEWCQFEEALKELEETK